ncbi:MAG: hypothetical protein J7639_28230 [Paenibacillaceae bacterium]|nr:hypothetical protein [Paenibacillaceae bacterium]
MSAKPKLVVTETEPTPIVKDFMTFAAYAETHEILLTKKLKWLPCTALQSLNKLMTVPEPEVTEYSDQNAYPLLTLFHHLALAAKLFRTELHSSGQEPG